MIFLSLLSCDSEILDSGKPEIVDTAVYPPENCTFKGGDFICDFNLLNQFNENYNLYSDYGKVTVIDISTMWCGYCQRAAPIGEALSHEYGEGFSWATVLIEDEYGNPCDIHDAQRWAGSFELNHNVLQGSRDLLDEDELKGFGVSGYPSFYVLDENFRIRAVQRGWSETALKNSIKEIFEE